MIRLKRLYANNFKQLSEIELHFPSTARILVQGKNEAGKSTLFEAIFFALFGSALATETGARGLDGLIAYEAEKARVELDVASGDRLFKITRTIVRGKSNAWELDIVRPADGADQAPEEIRGNTAVNKRLLAELGFDGEALLNTCFVEQKKLEKLEGLSRAKREESLAKLLNLDAVVALENDLKVRAEDKQELDRLKKRSELADIQFDLPSLEEQLGKVESRLELIDLRRSVEGAAGETLVLERLDGEIRDLVSRREAIAQKAERIGALKEAMVSVKEARDTIERLNEIKREIERGRTEQKRAQSASDALPLIGERAAKLRQLTRVLRRLDQVRVVRSTSGRRVEQLAAAQARIDELNTQVAREEQRLEQLGEHYQDFQRMQALDEWIAARRVSVTQDETESLVQAKQLEHDRLSRRFRIQVYGLATLLLFFVVAAWIAQGVGVVFIGLAAVTLAVLALKVTVLWRDLSRAAQSLGQAQGEAQVRSAERESQAAQVSAAANRLDELSVPVPESMQAAGDRRAAISAQIGLPSITMEGLLAEQQSVRDRLVNARAVLGELCQQQGIQDTHVIGLELDRCRRISEKADSVLVRWTNRIQNSAQSLAIEPDAAIIQQTLYQLDAQKVQIERQLREAARLDQEMAQREQQARGLVSRAHEAYERARACKPERAEWNESMGLEDYNAFGKDLRSDYDSLGGEAIVKQGREIEGEIGRRQGEHETRARNAATWISRTIELLAKMGRADELPASPSLQDLTELRERFQGVDLGEEANVRIQQRDLVGRLHSLRDRQSRLERELGLAGEMLERAACRVEYEEKARQTLVRERGVEIMSLARRRIVHKVLPATMDYMRQILPTLTRDRYHDAQLDSESYKIQVWDERAGQGGAFKEKNIFSGGTKDQFSLALRLAFALATLPQERGTAPSFIFLDEPLGSFDEERADALIYLLTEGEIGRAFEQIFLISHVHVDERLFTHRIILENGRVQFTDLQSGPSVSLAL